MEAVATAQQLIDFLSRAKRLGDSLAREALSLFVVPGCWLEPKLLDALEDMIGIGAIYRSFADKPEIRQLRRQLDALDDPGRARFRAAMEALLMAKRTHLPINSEAIKDFLINNDWQTADSEEAISIAFMMGISQAQEVSSELSAVQWQSEMAISATPYLHCFISGSRHDESLSILQQYILGKAFADKKFDVKGLFTTSTKWVKGLSEETARDLLQKTQQVELGCSTVDTLQTSYVAADVLRILDGGVICEVTTALALSMCAEAFKGPVGCTSSAYGHGLSEGFAEERSVHLDRCVRSSEVVFVPFTKRGNPSHTVVFCVDRKQAILAIYDGLSTCSAAVLQAAAEAADDFAASFGKPLSVRFGVCALQSDSVSCAAVALHAALVAVKQYVEEGSFVTYESQQQPQSRDAFLLDATDALRQDLFWIIVIVSYPDLAAGYQQASNQTDVADLKHSGLSVRRQVSRTSALLRWCPRAQLASEGLDFLNAEAFEPVERDLGLTGFAFNSLLHPIKKAYAIPADLPLEAEFSSEWIDGALEALSAATGPLVKVASLAGMMSARKYRTTSWSTMCQILFGEESLDLAQCQLLLFPCFDSGHFFLLAIIDPSNCGSGSGSGVVMVLDSLGAATQAQESIGTRSHLSHVEWAQRFIHQARGQVLERYQPPVFLSQLVQQSDMVSCGYFVVFYARCFMRAILLREAWLPRLLGDQEWIPSSFVKWRKQDDQGPTYALLGIGRSGPLCESFDEPGFKSHVLRLVHTCHQMIPVAMKGAMKVFAPPTKVDADRIEVD